MHIVDNKHNYWAQLKSFLLLFYTGGKLEDILFLQLSKVFKVLRTRWKRTNGNENIFEQTRALIHSKRTLFLQKKKNSKAKAANKPVE